jgi:hypothetical protein
MLLNEDSEVSFSRTNIWGMISQTDGPTREGAVTR